MNTKLFSRSSVGKALSHATHEHCHAIAGMQFILEKADDSAIDKEKMQENIQTARNSIDYLWKRLKELHDETV